MHPEIIRALMAERVRQSHADATTHRRDRVRRPRLWLSRYPRPRAAWTTRTV
jgi:hypothetical protein